MAIARKKIEDQIENHSNAIIMLKHHLNAMTTISRLPGELLSEIFVCFAQDYFRSYTDLKAHTPYYSHHRVLPEWVRVAHVCHAWREMALSTPRLWSFIPVTQRSIAEQLLVRSKKAPLSVAVTHLGYNADRKRILEAIFSEEMCRVRELFISGPSSHVYELCAKLTEPAEKLHTLALSDSGDNYTRSDSDLIPQNLCNGHFPRLRSLEIRRLVMRWDNPLLSSALTNLVVIQNMYRDSMGTFDQFISTLESMSGLQSVEFTNAIPPISPDSANLLPPSRAIAFPHLRDIRLHGSATDCTNFLCRLSLGADIQLQLVCREETGIQDLILSVKAALARSSPWRTVELAQRFSTDVTLRAWPTNVTFTDSFRIVELPSFTLELSSRILVSGAGQRPLFEQSSMFQNTETFVVDACTEWKWKDTFTAMSNLRQIFVLRHAPESMLEVLCSGVSHGKRNRHPSIMFPRLEVLKFYDVRLASPDYDEDEEYFDRLIDSMIFRCNYDHPVQEVHITECRNILDEDVVRLRGVVPEVVWDGVEDIEEEEEEDEEEEEFSDEEEYDPFEEDLYYDPFFDDPYNMW
ncbi:hypothetical protein GSI_13093 [Ganoderma sinense ZZ0214-1]|uniref:F-box domain-containing protein n=1 Tax=Ganoderma sinense ZZ0214-1 TaxID=1077348 RepID=A0A2G8RUP6_9APHY|nr:hypothetical protein GSI_13093 [Ganoderma sinense ZZ0214-1]